MAKEKLEISYYNDYKLIAIATSLKDYRVSFLINNTLGINLKKVENLKIDNKKKAQIYSYELHIDKSSNADIEYLLTNNKTVAKQLLPSLKGIDYVFILKADKEITTIDTVVKKIKAIKNFNMVLKIDKLSTRDRNLVEKEIIYKEKESPQKT